MGSGVCARNNIYEADHRVFAKKQLIGGIALACLISAVHAAGNDPDGSSPLPNVLLVLADDMGWGDARVYNPDSRIQLPNIEQLAAEGMRFTNAHAPTAVCAPSRYSLLTGNYSWRGRDQRGVWTYFLESQILSGQKTIGNLLSESGYNSAFIGKWHMGGDFYARGGSLL